MRKKFTWMAVWMAALILTACNTKPQDQAQQDKEDVQIVPTVLRAPITDAGLVGVWGGILTDGEFTRAVLVSLEQNGDARLAYCEDALSASDLPGATGGALFTFDGQSFIAQEWDYQTVGNGDLYPDACRLELTKRVVGDQAEYDDATGMMLSGTVLAGELQEEGGRFLGNLALMPISYDSNNPPFWLWQSTQEDSKKDMLSEIWSPWTEGVTGLVDAIISYQNEQGVVFLRSVYGKVDQIADLDSDGEREIIIGQWMDRLTGGDQSSAPYWTCIYHLNTDTGLLVDQTANFPQYYQEIVMAQLQNELDRLKQIQEVNGRCEQEIDAHEQLIAAAQAIVDGDLTKADPDTVYRYLEQGISALG